MSSNSNHWMPPLITVDSDIELEQITLNHLDSIFRLVQNNKKYLAQWLGWVNKTDIPEDTKKFIIASLEEYEQKSSVVYVIKNLQRIVGILDIHDIDWKNKNTFLGYWLEPSSSGKGIITLSCQTLIQHLFNHFQWNQLQIRCAPENHKSANVAKRLGFKYTKTVEKAETLNGVLIDLDVYSYKL